MIQICVDKTAGIQTFNNTIFVEIVGNKLPHLSNFSGQSLSFPWGTTQACFNLTIGSDQSSLSYTLGIQGSTEELDLIISKPSIVRCGYAEQLSTGSSDPIASDRFHNTYPPELLAIPDPNANLLGGTGCGCDEFIDDNFDTGIFEPVFEDCLFGTNHGFADQTEGPARRRTVCAVLEYLNQLIVANANQCPLPSGPLVNVRIQPSMGITDYYLPNTTLPAIDPDFLGVGSPYYVHQGFNPGIDHPAPWVIINSGNYPINLTESDFHAYARINFNNFTWHTDYETDIPVFDPTQNTTPLYDLYTVALHELTHALGFASSFSRQGGEVGNLNGQGLYYNFDQHLQMLYPTSPNPTLLNLIVNGTPISNNSLSMNWFFNTNINVGTDFYNACSNTSAPDVIFSGQLANYKIYTGTEYEPGSSFSHLDGDCPLAGGAFVPFVMHPNFGNNNSRRRFLEEELDVLRTTGYNIDCTAADFIDNNPNITFDCSANDAPCAVASVTDMAGVTNCISTGSFFIKSFCPDVATPEVINFDQVVLETQLRSNDPNATQVAFIQPLFADNLGQWSYDPVLQRYQLTTSIWSTFNFAYAISDCDGNVGNLVFFSIKTQPGEDCSGVPCLFTTCAEEDIPANFTYWDVTSTINPCNILCNGGFDGLYARIGLPSSPVTTYSFWSPWNTTNGAQTSVVPSWQPTESSVDELVEADALGNVINALGGLNSSPSNEERFMNYYIPIIQDQTYLFAFNTGQVENLPGGSEAFRLKASLLFGEQVSATGNPANVNYGYNGTRQEIFSSGAIDHPSIYHRVGNCFTANDFYSALEFYAYYNDDGISARSLIDNVELIPDDFSAGDDIFSPVCYQPQLLGASFCMISDVSVNYSWYIVNEQGNVTGPSIYSYTCMDGDCTSTPQFTVAPGETTTYRLIRTVTNAGNTPTGFSFCTTEDDVTITVAQEFPIANFTSTETDCGVFNLTSNPAAINDEHEWYLDGQLFSTDINTGVILSDGSHLIRHVVTNVCGTVEEEISITVTGCGNCQTPAIGFTVDVDCDTQEITITTDHPNQYNTNWDITVGSINIEVTGDVVTIPIQDITTDQIYTIEQRVNDGSCINILTLDIPVDACAFEDFACPCTGPNAINIAASTGTPWQQTALAGLTESTSDSPNTIDLTGRCVAIDGRLLIDDSALGSLLFENGALRMQPDAEIVVENGAELIFRNVDQPDNQGTGIHSCDHMWVGITVEAGSTLDMEDSQIEDARHAVRARNQSTLRIVDNIFDNNNVGIFIPTSGMNVLQTINTPPGGFLDNLFDSSTGLLGTLAGDIVPGIPGQVGIDLRQVSWVQAGSIPMNSINRFQNLDFGIRLSTSAMGIYNARFENLNIMGIQARRNSFVIAVDNNFDNIPTGIQAESSGVFADINTISNVDFGISSFMGGNGFDAFEMFGNIINARGICARVEGARHALTMTISDQNILTLDPDSGPNPNAGIRAAIRIADPVENTVVNNAEINGNNITISDRGDGIRLEQVGEVGMFYNIISYLNAEPTGGDQGNGIILRNADDNYLYGNEITTAGLNGIDAINIVGSMNTKLCCNITDGTQHGLYFQGMCNDTDLRTTTIGNHTIGLLCDPGTRIGTQSHTGNNWTGMYATIGARHNGNDGDVSNSRFIVDPAFLPSNDTPNASVDWFLPSGFGGTPFCGNDSGCSSIPDPAQIVSTGLTTGDQGLVAGNYSTSPYAQVQTWEKSLQFYQKLNQYPGLMANSNPVNNFYNTLQSNGTGAYYNQIAAMKNAFVPDAALKMQFEQTRTSLQNEWDGLEVLDMLYTQATTEAARNQIAQDRMLVLNGIENLWSTLVATKEQQEPLTSSQFSNLQVANNALPTLHTPADNQKIVNDLLLQNTFGAIADYSAAAISALEAVAYQCPLEGGHAVYRARTLLSIYGGYDFLDDDPSNCGAKALQQAGETREREANSLVNKEANTVATQWQVAPNPATTHFYLSGGDLSTLKELKLLNLNGTALQVWQPREFSNGQINFNSKLLSSGIYYLQLTENDGSVSVIKVAIIN